VRTAQDLLRPMPSLLSYRTNPALAQADVNGGWAQRPRAWRFVVLRFIPGETLAFTPEQNEIVAQDHVNCLYRLRSCEVEERVEFDRIGRGLALAKFMIEADRHRTVGRHAWSAFTALAGRVQATMAGAFGARALIVNRVVNEVECERVDVEGQRPIGILDEKLGSATSKRTSTTGAGVRKPSEHWRATVRCAIRPSRTSTCSTSRSSRRSTSGRTAGAPAFPCVSPGPRQWAISRAPASVARHPAT
jgi:hypothetical protein